LFQKLSQENLGVAQHVACEAEQYPESFDFPCSGFCSVLSLKRSCACLSLSRPFVVDPMTHVQSKASVRFDEVIMNRAATIATRPVGSKAFESSK